MTTLAPRIGQRTGLGFGVLKNEKSQDKGLGFYFPKVGQANSLARENRIDNDLNLLIVIDHSIVTSGSTHISDITHVRRQKNRGRKRWPPGHRSFW